MSPSRRRPKPPPSSITSIVTSSLATPATLAATSTAMLGTWVEAHRCTLPSATRAVQFTGSIVAWARKGARYSAVIVFATLSTSWMPLSK
jgi:hypothetical protein